jgi:hypothetical protein
MFSALQQIAWRNSGTTRRLRFHIGKTYLDEIKPIDECVNEAHWVIRSHLVVERLWQQQGLRSVMAGDVWHAANLSPWAPHRNPLRLSFHTA